MYGTVSAADTYFSTQLFADSWQNATTEKKTAALTMAAQAIDRLSFNGSKYDESQAHQFPRGTSSTVPDEILWAAYHCALALLNNVSPEISLNSMNIILEGASINNTGRRGYIKDVIPDHIRNGIPSGIAWHYLRPYLNTSSGIAIERST